MSYVSPVHRYILFKTEEAYNEAHAILCTPIVTEGEPRGLMRRRERHELILAGFVGVSLGHGNYEGRRVMWFIDSLDEQDTARWALIQEVLSPLDPHYADDSTTEMVEFLGRLNG